MSQSDHNVRTACQVDLGAKGRTEVEIDSDCLWASVSAKTEHALIWIKEAVGGVDLRIHIERTDRGIALAVDRGDNAGPWCQGLGAPRLLINVTNNLVVEVSASMGASRERPLGMIDLQSQR